MYEETTREQKARMILVYLRLAEEEWTNLFEIVKGFNYYKYEFYERTNNFRKQVERGIKEAGGTIPQIKEYVKEILYSLDDARMVSEARMKGDLIMKLPYNLVELTIRFMLCALYIQNAHDLFREVTFAIPTDLEFCKSLMTELLPKLNLKTFDKTQDSYVITQEIDAPVFNTMVKNIKKHDKR